MTLQSAEVQQLRAQLAGAVSRHWMLFLCEGIVLVVLGLLALMAPFVASVAATVFFGWILLLSGGVGLVTLALGAIGIVNIMLVAVTERTREIGVRAALGASPANILLLILRQGMTLAGVGTAIGLLGAIAVSRALLTLLFGISPLDPLTYASVVAVLGVVAAVACWIPAHRAAQVDPAITLRAE